jgi:outer membrane receptor protein involved in Fe transport
VVVTATRQSDTVNKVPLSVTAVTQRALDQQGVKTVADFTRTVPSINLRRSGNDQTPNISIRGLSSQLGAATTGIYLDDIPLQKRGVIGIATGGGSPFPVLFDLERIEVLRGPQGTLFGASSEGGTIRFITPSPSLTTYSGVARAEGSFVKGGSFGYETGAAFGGPLIQDKLGFRLSLENRHSPGYIDHVSLYNGRVFDKDTNQGDQRSARFTLAWQATDKLTITPAFYYSYDYSADNDTWWNDVPQFSVNPGVFTNYVHLGAPNDPNRSLNFDLANKYYPGGTYGPYNQFGFGKTGSGIYLDTADNVEPARTPRKTNLYIPTFTVDYDLGFAGIKSITGFVYDKTEGENVGGAGLRGGNFNVTNATYVQADPVTHQAITSATGAAANRVPGTGINGVPAQFYTPVPGGFGNSPTNLVLEGAPTTYTRYIYQNIRKQFTQEFRLTSNPGKNLSYVAGAYYIRSIIEQPGSVLSNEADVLSRVRGIDEAYTVNIPQLSGTIFNPGSPRVAQISSPGVLTPAGLMVYPGQTVGTPTYLINGFGGVQTTPGSDVSRRRSKITESEISGFFEGNYQITNKLKFTAGVRVSDLKLNASQEQSGPVFGSPYPAANSPTTSVNFVPTPDHPFPNQPGDFYQNIAVNSFKGSPVNPKVGLSYQASSNDLYYVTVAKGYRSGGVNTPGTLAQCADEIAQIGQPTPLDYAQDSVWSYEGGAKLRLFGNRMQINSSVYYIDWKNPQLTVTLRCAFQYVTNAEKATSKGFDTQFQVKLFDHLTLNGTVAYTDARYSKDFGITSTSATGVASTLTIVRKDQPLGAPKWQYNIGAQYDAEVMGRYNAYVRADYQYSGTYLAGTLPGLTGYDPLTAKGRQTHFMTARAGVNVGKMDAAIFVNNLTNSQNYLTFAHGQSSPLTTGSSFRPREIGVQLNYRY